ncbi:MAG: PilZ domain-containing protein [Deltaproteobacteria bacterium]|nr:PilZ domain-containing protein [Deltaproteobacteria bacterium]
MTQLDRRFDTRIPFETYLTAYVDDRPTRGFTVNISETGLYLNTLPKVTKANPGIVGIELELPGVPETIWAAGQLCYGTEDDYFQGRGVKFTAMADRHARLVRQFCYRVRMQSLRSRKTLPLS